MVSVLANGGGQKEKVAILREPELFSEIPVPSSNPRTYTVLLPEGFTEYIYHVGNGKALRSIVNNGVIPGGVSLETRQTCCVLRCRESDG